MNNKNLIVPGTVIISSYLDFEGKKRLGDFVVLYDEALDDANNHKYNIVAIKITTSQKQLGAYTVPLTYDNKNTFFNESSFACCSKLHVINKAKVKGVLGVLDTETYLNIFKTFEKFQHEISRQLISYL